MNKARVQGTLVGLMALGWGSLITATALPFHDKVEYKDGDKVRVSSDWLVPTNTPYKPLERGWGGLKVVLAAIGAGAQCTLMLLSRKEATEEPLRVKVQEYERKAFEFEYAAQSAYQMAHTEMRYKKLLAADEIAFERQIEVAFMESMGITPNDQPALTGTQTLDSINNPRDKITVDDDPEPVLEPEPEDTPIVQPLVYTPVMETVKMPDLTWYPSVLIYGVPGSGKTHFVEQEVKKRLKAGHRVIILDPHAGLGQWQGCEVIGSGLDYDAIDAKMLWFKEQVVDRYKVVQSVANPKFQPTTCVGEEFTNWAKRCKHSGDHFQTVNSDIRKVEMYSIIVSHVKTLAGLGNAQGMSGLRDGMYEIEILGKPDPRTGRATPKFEAKVKLPGQTQKERTLVRIPKLA